MLFKKVRTDEGYICLLKISMIRAKQTFNI